MAKTFDASFWEEVTQEMIGLKWLQEDNGVDREFICLAVDEVRKRHGMKELGTTASQYNAMNAWEKSLGGLVTRVQGKGNSYTLKAVSKNTYDYVKCYQPSEVVVEPEKVTESVEETAQPQGRRHEKKAKHEKNRKFAAPIAMQFVAADKDKEQVKLNPENLIPNLKRLLRYALKNSAMISLDEVKSVWGESEWSGEDIVRNIHKPLNKLCGFQAVNFRYRVNGDSVTFYDIEGALEQIKTWEGEKNEVEEERPQLPKVERILIKQNADFNLMDQQKRIHMYIAARLIQKGITSIEEICSKASDIETGVVTFNLGVDELKSILTGFPEWFNISGNHVTLKTLAIFEKISLDQEKLTTTILLSSPIWEDDKKKIESLMAFDVVYSDEFVIIRLHHDASLRSLRLLGRLFSSVYPVTVIEGFSDIVEKSKYLIEKDFQASLSESF